MSDKDWPLIISVGGSQQSKKWYANFLDITINEVKLCSDVVTDHFGGHHLDLALPGASNRRHIRRAMLACINELRLNPTQKKIVIFEISFMLRKEVWIDDLVNSDSLEGNFHQVQIALDINWWQKRDQIDYQDRLEVDSNMKKILEQWIIAERHLYSPYAETVNLYQDLLMFTNFLQQHRIQYVIFNGNPCEHLSSTSIIDTLNSLLAEDQNILDLTHFSFTQWCNDNQYPPLDCIDRPMIGHPCMHAHASFARKILIPILSETT